MSYVCAIYAFSAILCAMVVQMEHNQQAKKNCTAAVPTVAG
jgi:hypothetical protein